MNVYLDEVGIALPDVCIESYVRHHVDNRLDMHFSQLLILDVLRAYLIQIPVAERPPIQWFIYGSEVQFNDRLASQTAWNDKRTTIGEDAIATIVRIGVQLGRK